MLKLVVFMLSVIIHIHQIQLYFHSKSIHSSVDKSIKQPLVKKKKVVKVPKATCIGLNILSQIANK